MSTAVRVRYSLALLVPPTYIMMSSEHITMSRLAVLLFTL